MRTATESIRSNYKGTYALRGTSRNRWYPRPLRAYIQLLKHHVDCSCSCSMKSMLQSRGWFQPGNRVAAKSTSENISSSSSTFAKHLWTILPFTQHQSSAFQIYQVFFYLKALDPNVRHNHPSTNKRGFTPYVCLSMYSNTFIVALLRKVWFKLRPIRCSTYFAHYTVLVFQLRWPWTSAAIG